MLMYHPTDYGNNRDGSINTEYCHKWYQKDRFILPREENLEQEKVPYPFYVHGEDGTRLEKDYFIMCVNRELAGAYAPANFFIQF